MCLEDGSGSGCFVMRALGGGQRKTVIALTSINTYRFRGAPADQDTLVSRFVTTDYFEQQCGFYFPNIEFSRTEAQNNQDYLGWDIADTTRLMFSNGYLIFL